MKRKTTLSLLPLAASLAFLLLQGCGGNIARMPSEAARESNTAGMVLRLNTDVSSPSKVRVNAVLSSMDGFYLAYPQIRKGNGMYVAPEKRVNVW